MEAFKLKDKAYKKLKSSCTTRRSPGELPFHLRANFSSGRENE